MIREIVRDMKLHKKDIMLLCLIILLGFAVGFGMLYLIIGSYTIVTGYDGINPIRECLVHQLDAETVPIFDPVGKNAVHVTSHQSQARYQDK